jgi:hypothetical protein
MSQSEAVGRMNENNLTAVISAWLLIISFNMKHLTVINLYDYMHLNLGFLWQMMIWSEFFGIKE